MRRRGSGRSRTRRSRARGEEWRRPQSRVNVYTDFAARGRSGLKPRTHFAACGTRCGIGGGEGPRIPVDQIVWHIASRCVSKLHGRSKPPWLAVFHVRYSHERTLHSLLRFYLISITASNDLGRSYPRTSIRLRGLRLSLSLASHPAVVPSLPQSKLDGDYLRGHRIAIIEVNEVVERRQILDVPMLVSGSRAVFNLSR